VTAPDTSTRPAYDAVERFAVLAALPRDVAAFLKACKSRVASLFPDAPYLRHHPHLTLFVARDPTPHSAARAIIEHVAAAMRDPDVRTIHFRGWRGFENDSLAAGGTTLVLDVVPTPALFRVQHQIAEAWHAARVKPADPEPGASDPLLSVFRAGPARESLVRYGWPFVGPHWLPHATVAAIPADGGQPGQDLFRELLDLSTPDHAVLPYVELARVKGDEHETLATLMFG
jgi:hypothetical protein